MKYAFIKEHQALFSVERMCTALSIERSGYYGWLHHKPGLMAQAKRKYKVTTDSEHHLPIAPNLLARDFSATAMNQKWVGDISYIWQWLLICIQAQ